METCFPPYVVHFWKCIESVNRPSKPIKHFSGKLSSVVSHRGDNQQQRTIPKGIPRRRVLKVQIKTVRVDMASQSFALDFSKSKTGGSHRAKPTFMPLYYIGRKCQCQCLVVCLDRSKAENEAIESLSGGTTIADNAAHNRGHRWENAAAGQGWYMLGHISIYAWRLLGKAVLFGEQNIDSLPGRHIRQKCVQWKGVKTKKEHRSIKGRSLGSEGR